MPFVEIPGLPGKVYVPEKKNNCCKKHPCNDCFSCEYCSDDRCNVCRSSKKKTTGINKNFKDSQN
ncbi:MAG: hypothetical protein HN417_05690 [Desulfobacula sp.]|nr:hypothetical protein [Desulfobacula sp.]MBT6338363.1 hypothetical protein [Desulfobacula sp.]MBT7261620.1 hypothetical protein [Desulfobacula sp.]